MLFSFQYILIRNIFIKLSLRRCFAASPAISSILTYKDLSGFVNTNIANIGVEKAIRMLYSVAFKNRDGLSGPASAITWN